MTRRPLVLIPLLLAAAAGAAAARETFSLDRGWRFHLGDPAPFAMLPNGTPVTGWQWMPAATSAVAGGSALPTLPLPAPGGTLWKDYRPGDDVFGGVKTFAWFRVALPDAPAAGRTLHFTMLDD